MPCWHLRGLNFSSCENEWTPHQNQPTGPACRAFFLSLDAHATPGGKTQSFRACSGGVGWGAQSIRCAEKENDRLNTGQWASDRTDVWGQQRSVSPQLQGRLHEEVAPVCHTH